MRARSASPYAFCSATGRSRWLPGSIGRAPQRASIVLAVRSLDAETGKHRRLDMPAARTSRLSPRRLAESAVARPGRVLAVWGALVLLGFVLIGGLLGSALSSEGDVTSTPESKRAEQLIDERLPQGTDVDEVVIVSSRGARVTDPSVRR